MVASILENFQGSLSLIWSLDSQSVSQSVIAWFGPSAAVRVKKKQQQLEVRSREQKSGEKSDFDISFFRGEDEDEWELIGVVSFLSLHNALSNEN